MQKHEEQKTKNGKTTTKTKVQHGPNRLPTNPRISCGLSLAGHPVSREDSDDDMHEQKQRKQEKQLNLEEKKNLNNQTTRRTTAEDVVLLFVASVVAGLLLYYCYQTSKLYRRHCHLGLCYLSGVATVLSSRPRWPH